MKCPAYETPYCKSDGQPCTHVVDCRNGYLKFWTEAERAFLKNMGRLYVYHDKKYRDLEKRLFVPGTKIAKSDELDMRFEAGCRAVMEVAIWGCVSAAIKAKKGE